MKKQQKCISLSLSFSLSPSQPTQPTTTTTKRCYISFFAAAWKPTGLAIKRGGCPEAHIPHSSVKCIHCGLFCSSPLHTFGVCCFLPESRYDGRGALADLRECEAPAGGFDLWASLSVSERRVEQLCDEERYRALTHNEEEEALYQEEELKRLQQALSAENTYGQVAYQYDESGQPVGEQKPEGSVTGGTAAEEDEPFVAPPELDIPLNMVLPETVKANAIIEKTALFINEQGAQMEILLKMKQANNPQFKFLSYDDPVHAYYRHLLMAIKTGRYRPKPPKEEEQDEGDQDDEDDGYYLHPSLASSVSRIELAPSIPSINYKPSADCAYSMLVNKIRDKQAAFVAEETLVTSNVTVGASGHSATTVTSNAPSEQESVEEEDVEEEEIETPSYPAYKGNREDGIRGGKVGELVSVCPVVGTGRKRRKRRGARRKRRSSGGVEKGEVVGGGIAVVPTIEPPPEMQIVIDKMASYVAKNGRDFETIVKSKGDPRFSFLDPMHQFNSYYRIRLQQYEVQNAPPVSVQETAVPPPVKKLKKNSEKHENEEKTVSQPKLPEQKKENQEKEGPRTSAKLAPVCFSIKKPKEVEILPLDKRSALLLEETSEEEGEEEAEGIKLEQMSEETEHKATRVKQTSVDRIEHCHAHQEVLSETMTLRLNQEVPVASVEKKEEVVNSVAVTERQEVLIIDIETVKTEEQDTVSSITIQPNVPQETPSVTTPLGVDDVEIDKDMFLDLGESNSPGGLSPTSAANRERHLQQERRRKAAIFLRMIKKEHPPDTPLKPIPPTQTTDTAAKTETAIETIVVEDDDSCASVPSPPVITLSKSIVSASPVVKKKRNDWNYPSQTSGGHNGLSSFSSRDKPYRKHYLPEGDGREGVSPMCHRRHHHHHRTHKHKHRKETPPPALPSSSHKSSARSRSRSRSKSRSVRPTKEGSSLSKHKKAKKKKPRSRSRSRSRRHYPVEQRHHHHHHHKKSKHHSHHKGKRRDRDDMDIGDDYQRRRRSHSREERKYSDRRRMMLEESSSSMTTKPTTTSMATIEEGHSSRGRDSRRREESSAGSTNGHTSGSESSDSRDSAR